jgi:hypothetical protein
VDQTNIRFCSPSHFSWINALIEAGIGGAAVRSAMAVTGVHGSAARNCQLSYPGCCRWWPKYELVRTGIDRTYQSNQSYVPIVRIDRCTAGRSRPGSPVPPAAAVVLTTRVPINRINSGKLIHVQTIYSKK